jgi:hypothetical protein
MKNKALTVTEQLQIMKQPIVSQCMGAKSCSRIEITNDKPIINITSEGTSETTLLKKYCKSYAFPAAKWRNGKCNMADHIEIEVAKKEKVRVGQQKQKQNK